MPHNADGYEMSFTHRASWKAHISQKGKVIETVPVTWTKGWRVDKATKEIFLEVWYKDREELERQMSNPSPFHVALAVAVDYETFPHAFKSYQGLFNVMATGRLLTDISLETRVLERVRAPN